MFFLSQEYNLAVHIITLSSYIRKKKKIVKNLILTNIEINVLKPKILKFQILP